MAKKSNTIQRFRLVTDDVYHVDVKVKRSTDNTDFFDKLIYGNSRKIKSGMVVLLESISGSTIAVWDEQRNDILFTIREDDVLNNIVEKSKGVVGCIYSASEPNDDFYDVDLMIKTKKVPKKLIIPRIFIASVLPMGFHLVFANHVLELIKETKEAVIIGIQAGAVKDLVMITSVNGANYTYFLQDKFLYLYLNNTNNNKILISDVNIPEDAKSNITYTFTTII